MTEVEMAAVVARLQRLEDIEALRALVNEYARTADAPDWDAWQRLWTEDAVFSYGPYGDIQGAKAIRDACESGNATLQRQMHYLTNVQFKVDGDAATGEGYLLHVGIPRTDTPGEHADFGTPYRWEFVRTADGWKISGEVLDVVWRLDSVSVEP
jgi:ketosteroid isomerase-like protein